MQDTIIFFMNEYGYIGIFLLIMLENIFPPIPSEIVLGFGGYMTSMTNLTMFGVIFISSIASCIGALILYFIGYLINKERLIKFANSKFGKMFRIKEKDILKANNWFLEKGYKTILFGRFIPLIRSLISIPAGISKMPLLSFLLLTFIGTFIWNAILTIIGSHLGNRWNQLGVFIGKYSLVVFIIISICIIIFIFFKINKKLKSCNFK